MDLIRERVGLIVDRIRLRGIERKQERQRGKTSGFLPVLCLPVWSPPPPCQPIKVSRLHLRRVKVMSYSGFTSNLSNRSLTESFGEDLSDHVHQLNMPVQIIFSHGYWIRLSYCTSVHQTDGFSGSVCSFCQKS